MASYKFDSAGLSVQELGTLGPIEEAPTGRSAGIIGTSVKGPAFVPLTLGSLNDFTSKFGEGYADHFGPLAVAEWIRNATAVTFLRVLGVGDGKNRDDDGEVKKAGFTVGEDLPSGTFGTLSPNPFANLGGPPGRTYFLGCFMSESAGSTLFSSAGIQGTGSYNGIVSQAVPIIRGVLMAPSGVILRLSASGGGGDNDVPPSPLIADDTTARGTTLGSVRFKDDSNVQTQDFVILLNGFNNPDYETCITASFDLQSPRYISQTLNVDPLKIQERGHYLAATWDLHPAHAILTGTGVVIAGADLPDDSNRSINTERSVFIITSSLARDTGDAAVPNYESWRNRFTHAKTPWFISQNFQGVVYDLFRFHLLDSGAGFASEYKVAVSNLRPSEDFKKEPYSAISLKKYGTFDVHIRALSDPDNDGSSPLESFVDVSLDPMSDRYISKVIGDLNIYYDFDRPEGEQRLVHEGNYPLKSRLVRVEVSVGVSEGQIPPLSLPFGFRGIQHLVTSGSSPLASLGPSDSASLVSPTYLQNTITAPLPFRVNNLPIAPATLPSAYKTWGVLFDHTTENSNEVLDVNNSFAAITSYFPDNSKTRMNFVVGDNSGTPETLTNGVLDADKFCRNFFTLENIKIVTGSNGFVDPVENWQLARYVRDGVIATDDVEKVRRVSLIDMTDTSSRSYLSYTSIFQGGFNGLNIFDTEEFSLSNAAVMADMQDPDRGYDQGPNVMTYKKALDIMGDVTSVDVSVLAIPGIRSPIVTDYAIQVSEDRKDSIFIMDLEEGDNLTDTVGLVRSRGINSSYVASYYPDVVIKPSQDSVLEIASPPSVAVLGALSLNDSLGGPWFAPAGATRGKLVTSLNPTVPLKEKDLDLLYSNDINPIYSATNINILDSNNISGVLVWGQKTMQRAASSLDRINVRRLLIEIRREARLIALSLLFESDRDSIIRRFTKEMTRRLQFIQSSQGLESFRIDFEASSQNDVENNTLRGKVYVRPKKTIEFLSIDFIVANGLQSEI